MSRTEASARPGAVGFRIVGWAALVVLAVACVAGWFGYVHMIRYERRAVHHIPPSAQWAVHVDVESVIVYDPVRRHLIPLLDAGAPQSRLRRLRRLGNLNFARDVREVLVTGSEKHWLVVLGGLFADRSLVDLMEKYVLEAEQWAGWRRRGKRLIQTVPPGRAMAQSSDGLWLIADSEEFLDAALVGSERWRDLGLSAGADASWGILPGSQNSQSGLWVLPGLTGTRRLIGSLSAKQEFRLEVELENLPGTDLSRQLSAWQPPGGAQWEAWLPTVEWGGERGVLLRLEASQRGEIIHLRSHWTRTEADRAAKTLAAWAERWTRSPGAHSETF